MINTEFNSRLILSIFDGPETAHGLSLGFKAFTYVVPRHRITSSDISHRRKNKVSTLCCEGRIISREKCSWRLHKMRRIEWYIYLDSYSEFLV